MTKKQKTANEKTEHAIQNEGRNALAGQCMNFRANTGKAWTGNDIVRLPDGSMLIRDPRPFTTGLPPGFADTFGLTPVTVTQDMVGQTIGVFHAIEYKAAGGRVSPQQQAFIKAVIRNGGRAGVARSAEEAVAIALGAQDESR